MVGQRRTILRKGGKVHHLLGLPERPVAKPEQRTLPEPINRELPDLGAPGEGGIRQGLVDDRFDDGGRQRADRDDAQRNERNEKQPETETQGPAASSRPDEGEDQRQKADRGLRLRKDQEDYGGHNNRPPNGDATHRGDIDPHEYEDPHHPASDVLVDEDPAP